MSPPRNGVASGSGDGGFGPAGFLGQGHRFQLTGHSHNAAL